jgi:hypothetical protein
MLIIKYLKYLTTLVYWLIMQYCIYKLSFKGQADNKN